MSTAAHRPPRRGGRTWPLRDHRLSADPLIGPRRAIKVAGDCQQLSEEVRRVIYTTNAIEALNRQLRKAIKTKGHSPNEDSACKLIYLAVRNATPQWTRCRNWTTALLAFKIHFGERLPDTAN